MYRCAEATHLPVEIHWDLYGAPTKKNSMHPFDALNTSIPCFPETINPFSWKTARVFGIFFSRRHANNVIISLSITGYMGDRPFFIFNILHQQRPPWCFFDCTGFYPLVFEKSCSYLIWTDGTVRCQYRSTLSSFSPPSDFVAFLENYGKLDCSWRHFIKYHFS